MPVQREVDQGLGAVLSGGLAVRLCHSGLVLSWLLHDVCRVRCCRGRFSQRPIRAERDARQADSMGIDRGTGLSVLAPLANVTALSSFIGLVTERWNLVYEMTRRDVLDRYAGQALGAFWVIFSPLLMMGVYVFAFTVLFTSRISAEGSATEYAGYILAALAPWLTITEVLGRAPTAITGNAGLVKQVIFPNEVLPLKMVLGALPSLVINLFVVLLLIVLAGDVHPLGWLLLPIPILCLVLMATGFAYFLAAIGVFLKDTKDIVAVLVTIGFFLHPMIYAPGVAPRWLAAFFYLSPISYVLWGFRDAIYYGGIVNPYIWIAMVAFSILIFEIGYRTYRILKPIFGNVL